MSKLKRKLNRKLRKNKNIIYSAFSIIILIIIVFLLKGMITGLTITDPTDKAKYEITEVDLFSIKDFSPYDVSVYNLKLGETTEDMLNKLGTPDIQNDFQPDITNYEYGKALDLEKTGLIIHTRSGIIKSINFKEPFNKFLKGKTKVDYKKEEIYWMFGKPDELTKVPLTENSILMITNIKYKNQGLVFSIRKNKVIGFSIND